MSKPKVELLDSAGNKPEVEPFKIAIIVPTRGACDQGFVFDLCALVAQSTAQLVANDIANTVLLMEQGTYIHKSRNDLVLRALEVDAQFMLWLDDDMRFPRDTLLRLLTHNVPIVGANYTMRKLPPEFVGIKSIGDDPGNACERLQTTPDSTGLERVDAIGFGCVLVQSKVFWDVGFPWFENYRDHDKEWWVGEDVDFCMKAREKGYDVFVDQDLSQQIRHVGTFEYSAAHAMAWEEEHGVNQLHDSASVDSGLVEPNGSDEPDKGLHNAVGGEV